MIEKLEIKINKLKRKLNPKFVGVFLFMLFAALMIFSLYMTNEFKRAKTSSQDEYNKAMYSAVGYINNVEVDLAKLLVTSTPRLTSFTLADIWKQSNLAKESLETIPITQNAMANASKYLTQVSDFSYNLMKENISNQKISQEEYNSIKDIYSKAQILYNAMQDIYDDLNDGKIKWDELEKKGNDELPNVEVGSSLSSLDNVGKAFQNYEGLIYDGAFSDHLLESTPKLLKDNLVSSDDAKEYIYNLFGKDIINNILLKDESNGRLELYNFEVIFNNSKIKKNISITKKDCRLYLMLSDRRVKDENLSVKEAKQKGLEFLKSIGIENVKDTYYQKVEKMAVINYAAMQDGVILYPDLIKIKVALDDGEICSVESQGYIFNHILRKDINPSITKEKAQSVINKNIEILSSDIAIIPTESKNEILTYEFKGKIDNREFLIYINAHTGQEEKVLLIINSENGILTM